MRKHISTNHSKINPRRIIAPVFVCILVFTLMSCGLLPTSSEDVSLQGTQMELSIQQTLMAQKATEDYMDQQSQQMDLVLQGTQTAMAAQILAAQQAAQDAQDALAAAQAEKAESEEAESPADEPAADEPAAEEPITEPGVDFETFKDEAKILLFEDMVNHPGVKRYVKEALDNSGLDYKDDGSAKGWLKSDVLSGEWDLIIVSLENLNITPTGEYFTYLSQALDRGSSVILEIWFLDWVSEGKVNNLLSKCGIEYEKDYAKRFDWWTWGQWDVNQYIVWPLPDKGTHPILNEPNTGFRWTNVTSWMDNYWSAFFGANVTRIDFGDFIRLSGKKPDAELLLGTLATEKNTHGVLAVGCNGRFIIQTFHTHNYAQAESIPLWENYIHNALKAKWLESQ
jgi:hypothetical protein